MYVNTKKQSKHFHKLGAQKRVNFYLFIYLNIAVI